VGHVYGYGRVSTLDQNPDLQTDALAAAGCERLFIDKMTGKVSSRPQLDRLLELVPPGDTVVVWKRDRLGRSIMDLIEIVTALGELGVGFRSLTEAIAKTLGVSRPTIYKHLRPTPVAAS
jgi:DNA invertase Pin-like site-specific DNA recombinase